MTITDRTVAEKIAWYLRQDISVADLVSWSEDPMIDGEFDENDRVSIGVIATTETDVTQSV